jgi:hypothetical protein
MAENGNGNINVDGNGNGETQLLLNVLQTEKDKLRSIVDELRAEGSESSVGSTELLRGVAEKSTSELLASLGRGARPKIRPISDSEQILSGRSKGLASHRRRDIGPLERSEILSWRENIERTNLDREKAEILQLKHRYEQEIEQLQEEMNSEKAKILELRYRHAHEVQQMQLDFAEEKQKLCNERDGLRKEYDRCMSRISNLRMSPWEQSHPPAEQYLAPSIPPQFAPTIPNSAYTFVNKPVTENMKVETVDASAAGGSFPIRSVSKPVAKISETRGNVRDNDMDSNHSVQIERRTGSEVLRPDNFNPNKESWSEYLTRFEEIGNWNGWSSREKAEFLRLRVSGERLRFIRRQPAHVQSDWSLLKQAFHQTFSDPGMLVKQQRYFDEMVKTSNESWIELAQRLRSVGEGAYGGSSGADDTLFEALLLSKFLKLLPDRLYQLVGVAEHSRLESAAVHAEKVDAWSRKAPPKPERENPSANMAIEQEGTVKELLDLVRESVGAVTSARATKSPHKSKSSRSSKKRDTYKKKTGKKSTETAQPSKDHKVKVKYQKTVCYKCSGRGHLSKDCPSISDSTESDECPDVEPAGPAGDTGGTSSAIVNPPN